MMAKCMPPGGADGTVNSLLILKIRRRHAFSRDGFSVSLNGTLFWKLFQSVSNHLETPRSKYSTKVNIVWASALTVCLVAG